MIFLAISILISENKDLKKTNAVLYFIIFVVCKLSIAYFVIYSNITI